MLSFSQAISAQYRTTFVLVSFLLRTDNETAQAHSPSSKVPGFETSKQISFLGTLMVFVNLLSLD